MTERATAMPRIALNKTHAAAALDVSVDFFDEHIAHEIPTIRRGRRRLYPVRELERWSERSADLAGDLRRRVDDTTTGWGRMLGAAQKSGAARWEPPAP